mmetsp:Transcript_11988/g.31717  ORF Transcript_11988/g.31717 Transcript_11988/m.31717 type:complete len:216 (-) Transcript_11988:2-649(-)
MATPTRTRQLLVVLPIKGWRISLLTARSAHVCHVHRPLSRKSQIFLCDCKPLVRDRPAQEKNINHLVVDDGYDAQHLVAVYPTKYLQDVLHWRSCRHLGGGECGGQRRTIVISLDLIMPCNCQSHTSKDVRRFDVVHENDVLLCVHRNGYGWLHRDTILPYSECIHTLPITHARDATKYLRSTNVAITATQSKLVRKHLLVVTCRSKSHSCRKCR